MSGKGKWVGEKRNGEGTHSVLAEGKWHVLRIATDLDVDGTELTESLGDSNLKDLIILGLK